MSERRCSPPVYGIETEYSCLITLPGKIEHELVGECHSRDVQLDLYKGPDKKGSGDISLTHLAAALESQGIYCNNDGMLSNGGRLYIDPSGPEYATPETSTAEEAVLRSFDGDQILLGVLSFLRESNIIEGYQLNRRAVDHNRSSRGVHLNTLTRLKNTTPRPLVTEWLATLNAAKGALFGSGGLLLNEYGETEFHHSPRLSLTGRIDADYHFYAARPLVRYPFKRDGERLARVETVTSDALNFGWPLRASLITTNALVSLIELGYGQRLPRLADAVASAQAIGRYGNDIKVAMKGPRATTMIVKPVDILRHVCETALELHQKTEHLDPESVQVLGEVIEVSDRASADIATVATQVESVTRLLATEQKMTKDVVDIDSDKICRFDYAWDWLGGRGTAERLREKRLAGWQGFQEPVSPKQLKKRLITPPQDTRAKVRGEAIAKSEGNDQSTWTHIDGKKASYYLRPLDSAPCH